LIETVLVVPLGKASRIALIPESIGSAKWTKRRRGRFREPWVRPANRQDLQPHAACL